MNKNLSRSFIRVSWITILLITFSLFVAAPLARAEFNGILKLGGGFQINGSLLNSDQQGEIRLKTRGFIEPLTFPIGNSISFKPSQIHQSNASKDGVRRIMMKNSDYMDGDLVDLTDEFVFWKSDYSDILKIPRTEVAQIFFPKSQSSLFFGPRDISDWQVQSGNSDDWNYESGSLSTSAANSSIFKSFNSLSQIQVHIKLSWKKKGDFLVALGTSDLEADIASAYRLETWSGELVAQRETQDDIDLFSISSLQTGPNELDLKITLNQVTGELITYSATGKKLGSLRVPSSPDSFNHGVLIKNKGGDLSVDRLNIIPLNIDLAMHEKLKGGFLIGTEGDLTALNEVTWKKDSQSFEKAIDNIPDDTQDLGPQDTQEVGVENIVVQPPVEKEIINFDKLQLIHFNSFDETPVSLDSIDCHGKARISGSINIVRDGQVKIRPSWIDQVLPIKLSSITKLSCSDQPSPAQKNDDQSQAWILDMTDVRMTGNVTGVSLIGESKYPALLWKPFGSLKPVAIEPGIKAFLHPKQKLTNKSSIQNSIAKNLVQLNNKLYGNLLLLKTGEIVPCRILSADKENVEVLTFFNKKAVIPLNLVRSLEMTTSPVPNYFNQKTTNRRIMRGGGRIPIQNIKNSITFKQNENLDKFLTLPRPRKYLPPTHLLRAINGDLLKVNFISMDDGHVVFELHETERKVSRDRIASISPIAVNPPEDEENKNDAPQVVDEDSEDETPIAPGTLQLRMENDYYINILPSDFKDQTLVGISRVLGDCSIPALVVNSISLKPDTNPSSNRWPYLDWVVDHAQQPIAATAKANDPTRQPVDPMVGQAAPDFALTHLSEGKVSLSDLKGQIVVLDFWASWCGPCMVAMPEIIEATNQFKEDGVAFFGVNVKEDMNTIKRTIRSREFDLQVLLDTTGVTSDAYGAANIPRTVVIDKEGKIAWARTGAAPGLKNELIKVLTTMKNGLPLDQMNQAGLNEPAPQFSSRLTSGQPFGLNDLNGKVVVLDFWATWCAPCIQAMPGIIGAVNSFEKDKVALLGINQGQDAKTIADFMKRKGWEFDVLLDMNQTIGADYGVKGIPHTVVVNQKGEIAYIQTGFRPGNKETLTRVIKNLLHTAEGN